jgi:hypothetical protein
MNQKSSNSYSETPVKPKNGNLIKELKEYAKRKIDEGDYYSATETLSFLEIVR